MADHATNPSRPPAAGSPGEASASAFELAVTPVHLGLGARAKPLPGFSWSPDDLEAYERAVAADGDEGRLVTIFRSEASWPTWERHPAGEELVVLLSGRIDLVQRDGGGERRIPLRPGWAAVNPAGVWHTADVHEPGEALFVTPGRGTEHEPR
ncbi:MAG TPA: cupin domain-containing protein [Acidimicrobiales bacterium]